MPKVDAILVLGSDGDRLAHPCRAFQRVGARLGHALRGHVRCTLAAHGRNDQAQSSAVSGIDNNKNTGENDVNNGLIQIIESEVWDAAENPWKAGTEGGIDGLTKRAISHHPLQKLTRPMAGISWVTGRLLSAVTAAVIPRGGNITSNICNHRGEDESGFEACLPRKRYPNSPHHSFQ
jgi:hypothetical protein